MIFECVRWCAACNRPERYTSDAGCVGCDLRRRRRAVSQPSFLAPHNLLEVPAEQGGDPCQ